MQIKRKIVRESFFVEDFRQQFAVSVAQNYLVVRDVFIFFVRSEIKHEQGHRICQIFYFLVRIFCAVFRRNQIKICKSDVGIANNRFGFENVARFHFHARRFAVFDKNLVNFRFEKNLAADVHKQIAQTFDECARSAHRKPHAEFLLQFVNHRVDRSRLKRISAD